MTTINVSIPEKLKLQAEKLIKDGYFASFSDVVRTSIRHIIEKNAYDLMAEAAKQEYVEGKTTTLATHQDVDQYLNKLSAHASTSNHK